MKEFTTPIVVVDLETLGRRTPDDGHIIEIGAVAVTPDLSREISRYSRLVLPPRAEAETWVERLQNEVPYVYEMHTKNGLIADLLALDPMGPNYRIDADLNFKVWLDSLRPSSDHLQLAGSGVLHYDRPYIRRWLPRSDRCFTYWAYDTGVMRRMLRLAGRPELVPGAHHDADSPDKAHRGVADCLDVVEELRAYSALLTSISPQEALA